MKCALKERQQYIFLINHDTKSQKLSPPNIRRLRLLSHTEEIGSWIEVVIWTTLNWIKPCFYRWQRRVLQTTLRAEPAVTILPSCEIRRDQGDGAAAGGAEVTFSQPSSPQLDLLVFTGPRDAFCGGVHEGEAVKAWYWGPWASSANEIFITGVSTGSQVLLQRTLKFLWNVSVEFLVSVGRGFNGAVRFAMQGDTTPRSSVYHAEWQTPWVLSALWYVGESLCISNLISQLTSRCFHPRFPLAAWSMWLSGRANPPCITPAAMKMWSMALHHGLCLAYFSCESILKQCG